MRFKNNEQSEFGIVIFLDVTMPTDTIFSKFGSKNKSRKRLRNKKTMNLDKDNISKLLSNSKFIESINTLVESLHIDNAINVSNSNDLKYKGIKVHKNIISNSYYARFRKNGKQHFVSAKTKKLCYERLKDKYIQVEKEEKFNNNSITFIDWYKKWLELYKQNKVKPATIEDYEKSLKYIPSEIKETKLVLISIEDVLRVLNSIEKPRTRQKVFELMSMMFDKAEKHDILTKNVMLRIDKPKHEKQNSQPLTKEQQEDFILACNNILHGDYFLVCLYQGLRKGEALAITREDIDFENKTLTINKSINKNNRFDTTKNKQSNRIMPLFDKTIQLLLKYKNTPSEKRIFNFSPKIQRKALNKINEKLTFHIKTKDLRSTFITRCQENHIPEFIIQSWVGHKIGSKVTSSVYTKHNPEIDFKYINIFNSII